MKKSLFCFLSVALSTLSTMTFSTTAKCDEDGIGKFIRELEIKDVTADLELQCLKDEENLRSEFYKKVFTGKEYKNFHALDQDRKKLIQILKLIQANQNTIAYARDNLRDVSNDVLINHGGDALDLSYLAKMKKLKRTTLNFDGDILKTIAGAKEDKSKYIYRLMGESIPSNGGIEVKALLLCKKLDKVANFMCAKANLDGKNEISTSRANQLYLDLRSSGNDVVIQNGELEDNDHLPRVEDYLVEKKSSQCKQLAAIQKEKADENLKALHESFDEAKQVVDYVVKAAELSKLYRQVNGLEEFSSNQAK